MFYFLAILKFIYLLLLKLNYLKQCLYNNIIILETMNNILIVKDNAKNLMKLWLKTTDHCNNQILEQIFIKINLIIIWYSNVFYIQNQITLINYNNNRTIWYWIMFEGRKLQMAGWRKQYIAATDNIFIYFRYNLRPSRPVAVAHNCSPKLFPPIHLRGPA